MSTKTNHQDTIREGLKAGLVVARECTLNTTYHQRVMNEALAALDKMEDPLVPSCLGGLINPAQPFWRAAPLTPAEVQLLSLVFAAHAASVARDNVSSVTLLHAFAGSGSYTSALAAALCTLGGIHAPIGETWDLLNHEEPAVIATGMLEFDAKIPGWGNSFVKGKRDSLWSAVELQLTAEMGHVLEDITDILHQRGKNLYPNPSAYTAAAALIVGMPRHIAPFLFVAGRLSAWTERLLKTELTK